MDELVNVQTGGRKKVSYVQQMGLGEYLKRWNGRILIGSDKYSSVCSWTIALDRKYVPSIYICADHVGLLPRRTWAQ